MCEKRWCVVVVALFLGFVTGPGRAERLVYEPFDYPPGGAVDGLNGGSGFAGPWEDEDASHAVSGNRLVGIDFGSIFRDFPAGTFVDDGSTYW